MNQATVDRKDSVEFLAKLTIPKKEGTLSDYIDHLNGVIAGVWKAAEKLAIRNAELEEKVLECTNEMIRFRDEICKLRLAMTCETLMVKQ